MQAPYSEEYAVLHQNPIFEKIDQNTNAAIFTDSLVTVVKKVKSPVCRIGVKRLPVCGVIVNKDTELRLAATGLFINANKLEG